MSNNIELKDLWQQKTGNPPDWREVYTLANKAKRQLLIKTILLNIVLLTTGILITAIWYYNKPQLLSTNIGICLTILAITTIVLAQTSMLPHLKKVKDHVNLNDYLVQLKTIRQKELFMQTTMMNVYFVLLSCGVLLYMYEYVPKTFLSITSTYGITMAWLAFNWFYLRPKSIQKQRKKTNELIAKFENLQKQLAED